jgi:hydrogenase maturation protease
MHTRAPKLVLGVGNLLRSDDGVGVAAVQQLATLPVPPDVEVFDAGTAGVGLTHVIEGRELVVAIDAIDAGAAPGTVYRLGPEQLRPAVSSGLSLHDLHLLHALDETRLLGTAPRTMVIIAVQVADTAAGIGLSDAVRTALPRVIALAAEELGIRIEHLTGAGHARSDCRAPISQDAQRSERPAGKPAAPSEVMP